MFPAASQAWAVNVWRPREAVHFRLNGAIVTGVPSLTPSRKYRTPVTATLSVALTRRFAIVPEIIVCHEMNKIG